MKEILGEKWGDGGIEEIGRDWGGWVGNLQIV